jgi:serine/threonine protein kinase
VSDASPNANGFGTLRGISDLIIDLEKDYARVEAIGNQVELYRHRSTGETVAVKSFGYVKGNESEVQGRFLREVENLMSLEHSCILRLKGCCLSHGKAGPKLVTEFCGGGSLKSVLEDPKKVPAWWTNTRKAITIAGIVLGMRTIHRKGILHRDLKPENVLFTNDFEVKIGDFGSSRVYEADVTMTGTGTPLYMAPEVRSGHYGPPSDVYSFGLILYEVVVGNGLLSGPGSKMKLLLDFHEGTRPNIPNEVLPVSKDLIEQCWSGQAESRPSFDEITRILKKHDFGNCFGNEKDSQERNSSSRFETRKHSSYERL